MTFINPKTEFGFKKIFASPRSKEVLISFLNAMLYNAQPTIQDLEIIDPYAAPSITGLKDTYLDVKAKITGNKTVIIEMQVINVEAFTKRVIYNAAKTYATQLKPREGYSKLNPVIALTITDFVLFENTEKFLTHFVFKEVEENIEYYREIELFFVELPKFNKELEQVENLIQSWVYFIKNATKLDELPEKFASIPEINTAFSIASKTNLSVDELAELEKREMFFEDQRGAITKSRKEGIIEGQIALILRQIARRTGEVSPEIQTRIQQLSPEQLDDLGENLLDFSSQEDLIAWLESISG
ncbi:Rpn family recombination-promoting nuclease/putative transposase [Tychonema sp. LEGE 07203]|uniref:Rpn family recombination-promoting nuclease/putative transposase n=1 Tax=Tychonema sp. LEGE 07203 TaxID=1828671 RepID=UPI00187FB854|nr:Rpn family recombination-promoting nuclease/putative transposase [Tychonema sp. LEGE 07203]MBE9095006.1 Rpn family recombination-promoting nuclease/putative transposase [Tychonema sp. LEGE 07203]